MLKWLRRRKALADAEAEWVKAYEAHQAAKSRSDTKLQHRTGKALKRAMSKRLTLEQAQE